MAASCCTALATTVPHLSIALPNTTAYNAIESSYYSLQEAALQPACILSPTTPPQVASAVNVLVSNHACSKVDFAIKGRTHAPAAGFANIEGGITIDMTGLSSVQLSGDGETAHVSAGADWLDVYAALDPHEKSVAGGRNGAVGVGGLTLGGGISYFSPQVGFTCDTVTNYEIVLASGELTDVNATSKPDLFKALKGGTNNFGVVTRFDFATVPISKILGGSIAYNISSLPAVFSAFSNIANSKDYDIHASIVMGLLFNSTSKAWAISSTPIYTLPESHPAFYSELFSIPNITSSVSITPLHILANETAIPPLNWQYFTGTYGVSVKLLEDFYQIFNATLFDFDIPEGVVWSFAFEPLPTAFTSHSAGKDSLGVSPDGGNQMILLISALWPDSASNAKVHAMGVKVLKRINEKAEKVGMKRDYVYANYADWSQQPIESYGKKNVQDMQAVAKKYDPNGVFQSRVPGGFKLLS